jgi:hypothetical protein
LCPWRAWRWRDSFEFNSADDVCFDPDCGTKDAAVTENDVAYPLSTETDNLVTYDPGEGEDGAVMVHNTDAKRKVRFESPSGAWTLTAGGGFTMEIRAKFDRSMTTVPFNSDKGVEFVVRTADNKTIILFLGEGSRSGRRVWGAQLGTRYRRDADRTDVRLARVSDRL